MASTLERRGWQKSSSSDIIPRFCFSTKHIAARPTESQGPGWNAVIEGTPEVSSRLRIGFYSLKKLIKGEV